MKQTSINSYHQLNPSKTHSERQAIYDFLKRWMPTAYSDRAIYNVLHNLHETGLTRYVKKADYARNGKRKKTYMLSVAGAEYMRVLERYSPDELYHVLHQIFRGDTPQ